MNNAVTNLNPHLERFGLQREPFSASADEGFFLLDSDRAQRLNMLYHLAQNSEALLLLTGIEGSGKTSLLQKFLAMGSDTWRYCLIRANAMMNPEQMLRHVAEGFGLEPDGINFSSALDTLKNRFIELRRSGLTALLLVDDTHELPAASLTVIMKLSELRDEDEGLIRIVLFSEPQIRDMLSAPELADVRHRITHTLEMPELNEQQTADYINYRLSVAGLDGKSPFSRGKLKKIHKLSHGIPALINEHANAMLHGGDTPQTETNKAAPSFIGRMKASMMVLGLLLIAGLATYFVMQDALEDLFDSDTPKVAQLELPEPKKPVAATPLLETGKTDEPPIKVTAPVETTVQKEQSETVATSSKETAATAEPQQQKTTRPINKFINNGTTTTATDKAAAASKPLETTVAEKADVDEAKPRPVIKPVLRTQETAKVEAPAKPVPAKPVTTIKPKAKPGWLASQNKNHFTLQLMGSRNKASVEGYRRSNKLGKEAAVIKTLHLGGEWYVLVYGSYTTKEKARAAIPKLPANLRKASPWPRKIGDLKP